MENSNTSTSSSREVNWLDLPSHLVYFISDKLLLHIKDYIRFGAVCHSWRSVYVENRHHPLPRQLPMLLLDDLDEPCLYDLSEKRVYNFSLEKSHRSTDYRTHSSTQGWLVIVYKKSVVYLHNPFLSSVKNKIELPHLPYFEHDGMISDNFLKKAVLSSNPASSSNYVVMAIYSQYHALAFYKRGDNAWTSLGSECKIISDVIYCKDQFYAVDYYGRLWACDVNSSHNKVSKLTPPIDEDNRSRYCIVESSGDLFCVRKFRIWIMENCYSTVEFKVFKLDTVKLKWFEIRDLGRQTLFLGDNTSLSLLASDYLGCKPNCIYFTEEYGSYGESDGRRYDMGVYNLEEGSIEVYRATESRRVFIPPIWIEPSLGVSE
ncbi:hypothetical protein AQUCO_01900019v1 [Aquilegia coerulea]|uniref:KIB1-4 beta-propeller domain-containing protein n=1 Tax=Aquilegia coerulea TaxID=218851 RepID=A0A2G5DIJ1_AQUCA|nr:hypothetical protein AQUCO_01900019v1 [Aquilegia coerulea]